MYWLLLPVAFATLWFGLRTTSPAMMAVWLAVTVVLVMLWTYFRFRAVFPGGAGSSDYVMTPMDAAEIQRMKAQAEAQRAAAAAAPPSQPRRDDDEPNLWLD